jgi:hypothetical protein
VATIQIILDAINNASRTFDEVAGSLETVNIAQDQAAESARALSDAQLAAANTAVGAFNAYSELRASANALAEANVNAAIGAEQLATVTQRSADQAVTAATSYSRLSDAQLNTAQSAVEAAAAGRAEAAALTEVTRDAALAAAGIRALSDAELSAAANATRTALAFRALTAAELQSAQASMRDAEYAQLVAAADARFAESMRARAVAEDQAAAAAYAAAIADGAAAIAARDAAAAADEIPAAVGRARIGWGLWGAAMGAFFAKVPLWGGLLDGLLPKFATQVAGWHIMLDAIIEVLAVWGPAIIAAGAWGVAASDAINDVIRHMTSLHTVSDAFGQSIPPMTSNLEKLHDAVRPQVYSIFGDALSVLTKRGGELNQVIMQTGQVFQQLAARAALAINSSQMSEFLHNSVNDVRLLGTAFGNLFGIIGNLIRMNQGWAGILLQVGTAFLGLIEHVTGLIIPLGQLLVFGHGFILWVGLAVTGAVKFGTVIAGWGAAIGNTVAGMVSLARIAAVYVTEVGLATAASEAFAAVNPMVWVGVAVGAVTGLVIWVMHAKDATVQWGDAMQGALKNAQSLSAGLGILSAGQVQVSQRLTQAATQLNATTPVEVAGYASKYAGAQRLNSAYAEQANKVRELTGIQKQLAGDSETYNTRLNDLAKRYGGVANAQGLLITSGVTMAQMLDHSGAAWEMIKQQVEGAYRGYGAMAAQSGVLGNAMQVLDKQATDQYAAMQKLNQGWDAQTAAMTGTQNAFDTTAQGFDTLANANQKVTLSLGKLKEKFDLAKAGIDSLTPSGIALNQAFTAQVGNINSLADSWRSAGISTNMFNSGLAASIAPLERYAKGSQEATAQLVGLAQEAGYQGPVSLQALNQYLGITSGMLKNTAGDMATMKSVANQATIQEALLTSAMQAQGNYIASQLIGDINNAILHYSGVRQAAAAYGNAVAQSGRQSTEAKAAQDKLTDSIIKAGLASGNTTGQIAAMIAKVLGIPPSVALKIVMDGEGQFTIGQVSEKQVMQSPTTRGGGAPTITGAARGARLPGYGGGDKIHVMAEAGETILPKEATADPLTHAVAKKYKVPGFQAGGVVGGNPHFAMTGDTAVLTGQRAVSDYGTFKSTFQSAMIHAMQGALVSAEKGAAAAMASAGGGGGQGPAPNTPAGNVRAVLQSLAAARGWTGAEWDALNAVEMREAGYNLNAQNPSSKAYGIAQFINGASEYAQYGGNSNTAAGQATAMLNYIAQRYGDPIAAEAHEQNFGWYDKGGLLPPGLSLALNQTGSNEMILPNGVIQGFTGGMQQLHPFFWNLTTAVAKLTDATTKAATASTATATAVTKQSTAVKTAPKPPTKIQVDQKKIADDKANAARLEARIKAVEQAIKDTPAKNKDARRNEENLLKQLQAALKTQNKGTGKDEAALAKEITKENKAMVASMQKAIAAITKLLGSGSAATSKSNALWTTLVADEKKLAAAQATLAGQLSGKSGGSSKITATLDKGSLSSFQAAEEKSFNAAVANLKAALAHPGGTPVKQITGDLATLMKRQAAEEAQYAKASADATRKNIEHLVALVHAELATAKDKGLSKLPGTAGDFKSLQAALTKLANAAEAAAKAAVKSTSGGGGGTVRGTSPGSASYVTGTVTDKRAESELAQLLTVAKQELAELKIMVAALAKIETEAAPAAQAKAIGPAVADAIQSTARTAAGAKTTRKG